MKKPKPGVKPTAREFAKSAAKSERGGKAKRDPAVRRGASEKGAAHPRNRHTGRYDLASLVKRSPALAPFLRKRPDGEATVDFSDARAVRALNAALLELFYGVRGWEFPEAYLCPPIPGRADYIHHAADLLASVNGAMIPTGRGVRVLDIGVGASAIYPLIGQGEYGWSFVGTDVDQAALAAAKRILAKNPAIAEVTELRRQVAPDRLFSGVVEAGEEFDLTICNPPFHASAEEAAAGTRRKWKGLGREDKLVRADEASALNFGGVASELWCPGGEKEFVGRMIAESANLARQVGWFSSLVSQASHLPSIERALVKARVSESRCLEMGQGQKRSRVVAWTFLSAVEMQAWRRRRWSPAV